MRRRAFIAALCGAVAWPVAVRAQQPERLRRIGVLMNSAADDPDGQTRLTGFLQGLQEFGWSAGRNIRIEYRWAPGEAYRRRYAAELVALTPDVIMASTSVSVAALQQASSTVPIVFAAVTDPVGQGFVKSLERPGGNTTGFSLYEYGTSTKWLELLKESTPGITRVAVIRDPTVPFTNGELGAIHAAPAFRVEVRPLGARRERNRTRPCCLREWLERRSDRAGEYGDISPSQPDHHACGEASTARGLHRSPLRHRWRSYVLRARPGRPIPPRSLLRRPHS
jgi:putative ABC transport system substrate-binding protein